MRFSLVKDDLTFGTEPFPGLLMKLCQEATLLKNILDLLTEFYNCLYNDHFTFILSITGLNKDVVVNSKIKLFGRLRISADIYGSVKTARHEKSSYRIARAIVSRV